MTDAGIIKPIGSDLAARLVARAAQLLRVQGVTRVTFNFWSDGEDLSYIASLEWADDPAPRVVVRDGRSGDFIGQSLVGDCYTVDPLSVQFEPADDELARYEWTQRARRVLGGERPEAGQSLGALADRLARDDAERRAGGSRP